MLGPGRHFISRKGFDTVKEISVAAGRTWVRLRKRSPSSAWRRAATRTGTLPQNLPVSPTFQTGPVRYILNYHVTLNTVSLRYSSFHSPLNNRKYQGKQNKSHASGVNASQAESVLPTAEQLIKEPAHRLQKRHCRAAEHGDVPLLNNLVFGLSRNRVLKK